MTEFHEPADDSNEFERIVLLINPKSTRAHEVKTRIKELEDSRYGPTIQTLITVQNAAVNIETLESYLKEGDALVVAGGDGTIHQAVTALAGNQLGGTKIPLLPFWGGNGNDLSYMLNGSPYGLKPSRILSEGNVVAVHPIHINLESEAGKAEKYAASYVGLGGTALGADKLNTLKYRKRMFYSNKLIRQAYELEALGLTLATSRAFTIFEQGTNKSLLDRTVTNGPRMAKYGRLPVQLTERRLFMTEITDRRHVVQQLGRLTCQPFLRPPEGEYIESDAALEFAIGPEPVLAHYDAEAELLPPATKVRIVQASRPFYALSTKLKV